MDKQQITGYIAVSADGGDALLLRRLVSRDKSNSSRAKSYVYTGWCPPTGSLSPSIVSSVSLLDKLPYK